NRGMTEPQDHGPSASVRRFLRTETGGAVILAVFALAALIWSNVSESSYNQVWNTRLSLVIGGHGLAMDGRQFVNSGLMALFFLVAGLEARREWDMGELRIRSRITLPFLAGLGGMLVPIGIYLAITYFSGNGGGHDTRGWGAAMSTDTAFALGVLAIAGKGIPDRVRTYLLTFTVVDDLASLAVIAIFYSGQVNAVPLVIGVALLAVIWLLRARGVRYGPLHALIGVAAWVAFFQSGVDPILSGLVIGLLTAAYPAAREDLEQASRAFRLFREQPTAELARATRDVVRTAVSPNEQLQALLAPAASYVIVPLFALANTDIQLSGSFLAHAYTTPVTLGVLIGLVAGKPLGTAGTAALATRLSGRRLNPSVGWGAAIGAGAAAGIPFTVSLLIAAIAFGDPGHAAALAEAKLGVLSAGICAVAVAWASFRIIKALPPAARLRALYGRPAVITDLAVAVDPERDHIRGPADDALVTLVEYGDFECPFCGQAEPVVRELIAEYGELRFVFRHLPLSDVHPHARLAAEGAEAAARQGKFWAMHDVLMDHQGALTFRDLVEYARDLDLNTGLFAADLRDRVGTPRIAEDLDSADLATVSGTPTFFINGRRHHGAYDLETLKEAVHTAKALAMIST
ncbi:MAG: Na+/H+ antiporter NhaA, partial [Nocardiopsaceae bacterium]|nr:Na+/H+ antiporter NhaA [Nocardiopsaceae bacterium]